MGVPPEMDVYFHAVPDAVASHARYATDRRHGILLTGDIDTMTRLVAGVQNGGQPPTITAVNLGGVHHRVGRVQRMRYVFLSPQEEAELRALASYGVTVTAQDVPSARPVPLQDLLAGRATA
jgi:PTS system mannose-specific IIB component/fructoselysine and glucoselysine-specific PTS system IIB component